ncbi:MAG TPA: DUF2997 domain-containing protein [Methanobacterium sp.]|nr:DUF2997 domain-containing protein [Methanobacterium sp.]
MSKKIQIQIFPDGTIQVDIQGIKGKRCTDYMKILEEILEAKTMDSDYTPEFYESDDVKLSTKQKQRIKRN